MIYCVLLIIMYISIIYIRIHICLGKQILPGPTLQRSAQAPGRLLCFDCPLEGFLRHEGKDGLRIAKRTATMEKAPCFSGNLGSLLGQPYFIAKKHAFPQNRIFFSGEPPIFVGKFIGTSPKSDIVRQTDPSDSCVVILNGLTSECVFRIQNVETNQ
jgi:hypothetical protein